ncbi:hypothetical protein QJQ45_018349 [Haematococcus lacustris]|nr:hypothetical protein QJQ45_018349 [Haematococcus lacustris]
MDKSSAGDVNKGQQSPGLQSLPANLLDAVLHQLDASSRLRVFRTSKLLATALLERFPRIQLTYPAQHDVLGQELRELAPFLTTMLQDRQQPKLHLTQRPARGLTIAIQQRQNAEPAVAASDAMRCLVARMLGAVPLCGAVDSLTISWHEDLHLPWEPAFSATLAASFPSLTSLTFSDVRLSIGNLAKAISHPLLLPRLKHLDIMGARITHKGDLGMSPYIGSRLERLSLCGWVEQDVEHVVLPVLEPLPPTLTKLEVGGMGNGDRGVWSTLAGAVRSLTQLQQLLLTDDCDTTGPEFMELLLALAHLPSLHTLSIDGYVRGQEQLDSLLALTQITRLELWGISGLTSGASAACSWRQLDVTRLHWVSAAYLPLHSLTHPLRLHKVVMDVKDPSIEVLAAAELNLCEHNQAGLEVIVDMCLRRATVDLLTELYLSHSRRTAQQPTHPTVASSSHSGPSTSLASSSSPEGHITPGGPGSSAGQGGQQGSAAGGQAPMQRLGRCVKVLRILVPGLGEARLSSANLQALPVLFPVADIVFRPASEISGCRASWMNAVGLLPENLDMVLRQLDASSLLQVFRTSKLLATALLERFPRIQLTYPAQHDTLGQDLRELAPFLTKMLQDRQQPTEVLQIRQPPKLHLTLRPARDLTIAIQQPAVDEDRDCNVDGLGPMALLRALAHLHSMHTLVVDEIVVGQEQLDALLALTQITHLEEGQEGLPPDVLDAVLHQLDARSRLQVFRTSKLLATALLERFPRIQLTYPAQHDVLGQDLRELAPFLTKMLQDRQQPTLHLTLRPARGLTIAIQQRQNAEPAAAAADAMRLVAWMLGAVPRCGAVDSLTISWHEDLHLPWEPVFSAALAASFASLTSLTFSYVRLSIGNLAKAINHPLLLPKLKHLDLQGARITHEGDLGMSPYIGRLERLSLSGWVEGDVEHVVLQVLEPLPPTLTQLEVGDLGNGDRGVWSTLAAAVRSLTQLQQLLLTNDCDTTGPGLMELLLALAHLPNLHTLLIDGDVEGQEKLDALLALTQITRLEVYGFSGLTSGVSAACSWRQLKVRVLDWVSAAYLPLHSLTHPLRLHKVVMDVKDPSIEVLAAAELNLCECNQAGLEMNVDMCLRKATVDLLTELYLSHSRRTAQQPTHPTVASSSHSGPSTSLASSSSPEGHITPGGPGSSSGQGGSAAGGQALMQRLGRCVKVLRILVPGLGEARLSSANLQALPVLFPIADIVFKLIVFAFCNDDVGLMDKSSEDEVITDNRLQGLHGLPPELLDAVLRQLDASSRQQVFRTSKLLATALLQGVPRIKLRYPTQHDIMGQHLRELAPFLTEVLQKRQHPKLRLTLEPASSLTDAIQRRGEAEPAAAAADAACLTAWTLGAVPLCGAVDCLTISCLHTLEVDEYLVGQEQLDALLALTQITRLELWGISGLTSGASAACSWRQLDVTRLHWVSAAYLPLHSLTHPLRLHKVVMDVKDPSIEVLAAAELNLCERNKAGLARNVSLCLTKATVDLLTEQYLTHSCRAAQQPTHPTVASSSSPEGHITPGGQGSSIGQGGQQGSAAGAHPLMQRLGRDVKAVHIKEQGQSKDCLSSANQQALGVLFPNADVSFVPMWPTAICARSAMATAHSLSVSRKAQASSSRCRSRARLEAVPSVAGLRYRIQISIYSQVLSCAVLWAGDRAGPMRKSSAGNVNKSQQLQGLQGLPMELLDAVLRQLDASNRLQVFRTSKLLATALLRRSPGRLLSLPDEPDLSRGQDEHKSLGNWHLALGLELKRVTISHEGQPDMSPFIGSKLQTLSLDGFVEVDGEFELLSGLLPLPPTLTQLTVSGKFLDQGDWDRIAEAVISLTQLQQLRHNDEIRAYCESGLGPMALLLALAHLPSLHTLQMSEFEVGQEQLDALLALTQITHLSIMKFSGLTSSWASAACSWRQLGVHTMDWVTAAYLPLNSLTHPLHLTRLVGVKIEDIEMEMEDIEDPSIEVLAAAELNLCERNKAGLEMDGALCLSQDTVDLLTEQHLIHSRRTAQHLLHPTVASSSSHSGPSTSLASSSSPEGHITPGGPGSSTGQGEQQGSAAGAQPLIQRLGFCMKQLHIRLRGRSTASMSSANWQVLAVLFLFIGLKVVERPNSGKPTDGLPGKVVTVGEFPTNRVSLAVNTPQRYKSGWGERAAPLGAVQLAGPGVSALIGNEYKLVNDRLPKDERRNSLSANLSSTLRVYLDKTFILKTFPYKEAIDYWMAGASARGRYLGHRGLPEELLDAVLRQLDASSRLPVFRTSKFLATALLRLVPRIQLAYPTQHDVVGQNLRELAPFLTEVLRNRQQPKLHLTLQLAGRLNEATLRQTRLVAWTLGAVPLCAAVDCLTINWHYDLDVTWEAAFSATLAASFPSLTSLTFQDVFISIGDLANAINHPLLMPRLLHLDLEYATIAQCVRAHPGKSPFIGSELQTLILEGSVCVGVNAEPEFLSGLLPLPLTLTQLEVRRSYGDWDWDWVKIGAAVSSLIQLQKLALSYLNYEFEITMPGVVALLPALAHLPSLHTLEVDDAVVGQEQLDALLALTQITSLKLLTFTGLTSSWASAACSWRQLEVHTMDWAIAAYLPLHSLTHPLRLHKLVTDDGEPSKEVLAAAELNLCVSNKAGLVQDDPLSLSKATVNLLTEQYLSHSHRTAQQPLQPTVASSSSHSGPSTSLASSSHSGPSTSLASSSSPEGHIPPGGPGSTTGQGGQQGSAAGAQPLMQRLGHYVKSVFIKGQGLSEERLSPANGQALAVLFPKANAARPSAILDLIRSADHFAVSLAAQRSPGTAASPGTSLPSASAAASLAPLQPATSSAASQQPQQLQCPSAAAGAATLGTKGGDSCAPGVLGQAWAAVSGAVRALWIPVQPAAVQGLCAAGGAQQVGRSRPSRQPSWQPDLNSLGGAAPWSLSPSRQPLRPLSVAQQVAAPGAAPSPPATGPQHSPPAPSPGVAPSPGQSPTAVVLDVEAVQQAGGSQAAGVARVGQVGGPRQRGHVADALGQVGRAVHQQSYALQHSSYCFASFNDPVGLMEKSSEDEVITGQQLQGLEGLPANLLDAVLCQLDANSRLPVFMTSKLLATALLRVVPRIQLTYPTQHDIQRDNLCELASFLTEVLQNRQQPRLHLTLHPDWTLTYAMEQRQRAEPAAAAADAVRLVARMLGAVPLCGAVDSLTISWLWYFRLPWEPDFSAALATSFPSLTSLTFQQASISIGHLATAINHPLLMPRLLHLDLVGAEITHEGHLGTSLLIGSRLQELSLCGWVEEDGELVFLPGLEPLPPTLTQLAVAVWVQEGEQRHWVKLSKAVSSLTQLQQLRLIHPKGRQCDACVTITSLLSALANLPSLHTLVLDVSEVSQEQLDALLELTQITHLEVESFIGLTSSRASADCSWRRLKVRQLDWVTAAYLPLHSLTHPLCLQQLGADSDESSIELLAAAELNLCVSNKAGLMVDWGYLYLSMATVDQLTELYLSHRRRAAQHLVHPTLASSSSPEGYITPGGPSNSSGSGGQQVGSAAGCQALMQRLGWCVKVLRITVEELGEARLSSAKRQALAVLFPTAEISRISRTAMQATDHSVAIAATVEAGR